MCAALDDGLHCSFDIDHLRVIASAVESGHVLVGRLEGYDLNSRQPSADFLLGEPRLLRGDDQCRLGRITLDAGASMIVAHEA